MRWYAAAAFLMCESTSAAAFLAFAFWRDPFDADNVTVDSGFNLLQGGGSSITDQATSVAFFIRLLLSWIGPFLLSTQVMLSVALCTCAYSIKTARWWQVPEKALPVVRAMRPFLLSTLLTHTSIALSLSILYYRSG